MASRSASMILAYFLVLVASVWANNDDDGEYWRKRREEAHQRNIKNYNPDPFSVTNSFNAALHQSTSKKMATRRGLGGHAGSPCRATNPIDRCWRCQPNWADDRQKMSSCAKGFGRRAYGGGRRGEIYVVTDSSDDELINLKPGTLRYAVTRNRPLWIIFDRDMVIRLQQELIVNSNKTIDGRGFNIRIAYGSSFTIQYVSNVIIHNIFVHDIVHKAGGSIRSSEDHYGRRTRSDGDGISVFGSSNIWLDHLTLANADDGLIDLIEGSTAITISNCHLTYHNDVMLFGAQEGYTNDTILQVTLAFNRFGLGLVQRLPRVRYGFAHVVNNDYTQWQMYAVGGSSAPTIVSQGNRFTAPYNDNAKEITKRDYATEMEYMNWNWTSDNDLYRNGAFFRASGVDTAIQVTKDYSRFDVFRAKPGSYVPRLTRYAGALACKVGEPC